MPSSHVFAFNWTNTRTRVLKNLAFPNYEYGKGQYAFTPKNYLVSPKKLSVSKIPDFIRGDNYKTPRDQQKNQKTNIIFENSRHPNFMNPFEYGQ